MGKKRIVTLDENQKAVKPEKVHISGLKGGQRIAAVVPEPLPEKETPKDEIIPAKKAAKAPKKARIHGRQYRAARLKVDPTKLYSLPEAIALVKETSFPKFDGSLEAHLVVAKTGLRGEAILPHFQNKTRRVAIANKEIIDKIESGKIDFDILLASPEMMPNLVKYAKILGPRGLMPNPKAGTIVEEPEKAIEKFQNQVFSFKTEANAPLIHTVFGKVSQKNEELEANLKALLAAVGPNNLKKVVIKATMGPAVKVDLQE